MSNIQLTNATVRAGRVHVLGSVFQVPGLLCELWEGKEVVAYYHIHDCSGVHLEDLSHESCCWAPFVASLDPFSPASGTTERQSHTDGPSGPAPSGGHQTLLQGSDDFIRGQLLAIATMVQALLLTPHSPARATVPLGKGGEA